MTATVVEPEIQATNGFSDDIIHLVCHCNEDLSLCGLDLSGRPPAYWHSDEEIGCVVCADMEETPCPRCGGFGE